MQDYHLELKIIFESNLIWKKVCRKCVYKVLWPKQVVNYPKLQSWRLTSSKLDVYLVSLTSVESAFSLNLMSQRTEQCVYRSLFTAIEYLVVPLFECLFRLLWIMKIFLKSSPPCDVTKLKLKSLESRVQILAFSKTSHLLGDCPHQSTYQGKVPLHFEINFTIELFVSAPFLISTLEPKTLNQ